MRVKPVFREGWGPSQPHSLGSEAPEKQGQGRDSLGFLRELLFCTLISPSVKRKSYLYPPYLKHQVQARVSGQANASCY